MTVDGRSKDPLAVRGVPTGFAHISAHSDTVDNIYRNSTSDSDTIVGIGLRLTEEGTVSIIDGNGNERTVTCVAPPNDVPVAVRRIRDTGTTISAGHVAVYVGES